MKRLFLSLLAGIFLLGSCATASLPDESNQSVEETQPEVVAVLNTNTPTGEIAPGNNVELLKFDIATNENISAGNFRVTWQEIKEPTNVSIQHLRLFKQDVLLDTTIETIPYGEPTIFLKDSSTQLADLTPVSFSLKGDVVGEGNFSLTVSFEARSSAGELLAVANLPLTGGTLILGSPPAQPFLTLLSPVAGNTFTQGDNITITWESGDIDYIDIDLQDWNRQQEDGSTPFVLDIAASQSAETGEFSWAIPSDWPAGDKYKIKINTPDNLIDYASGYFSIVAPPQSSSSITVLSPNGGEDWEIGRTYEINWNTTGTEQVVVDIVKYDIPSKAYNLSGTIPAHPGKFSWKIGSKWDSELSPGDNYKIRVVAYPFPSSGNWTKGVNYDSSDNYFSLVPAVRVTATLDGEPWEGPVIFDISRNENFDGMDATGQFQVPQNFVGLYSDLPGGANIYIRLRQSEGFQSGPETAYLYGIAAVSSNGVSGESDGSWIGPYATPVTFTFVFKTLPSITVLSPNGGEQWKVRETKRVSWQSTGVKYVRIYIYDETIAGSGCINYIYSDVIPADAEYYDWTIQQNQLPGGASLPRQYKMRIDGLNVATVGATVLVNDHSDNYFSIVSAPPPPPPPPTKEELQKQVSELLEQLSSLLAQIIALQQQINEQ